jgi:hypothetical protein
MGRKVELGEKLEDTDRIGKVIENVKRGFFRLCQTGFFGFLKGTGAAR